MTLDPIVLVVRSTGSGSVEPLPIRANGYRFVDADAVGSEDHWDSVILDGRHGDPDATTTERACDAARDRGPLLALDAPISLPASASTDSQHAGGPIIGDVLYPPFSPARIGERLDFLRRLYRKHEELAARQQIIHAGAISDIRPAMPPAPAPAILIVGLGTRYPVVRNAYPEPATVVGALSTTTARDYLEVQTFDGIVLEAETPGALSFLTGLRCDARFRNLAVAVLVGNDNSDTIDFFFQAGATEVLGGRVDPDDLAGRLTGPIRRERQRRELDAGFADLKSQAPSDSMTDLYARRLLLDHLDRLRSENSTEQDLHRAVALELMNLNDLTDHFGPAAGAHLVRQVGGAIGTFVRSEDFGIRWNAGRFVILLAGDGSRAVDHVTGRLRGIVNHTAFATPDGSTRMPARLAAVPVHDIVPSASKRVAGFRPR
ncbi:MAG: diguanylate cyclase [Pseudomonadota bacterium]